MHRLHAECADKPEADQVQIAIHEAVQAHELALAMLTCLMMHGLLTNLAETCVLGEVGDKAVHFSIHLDVLHHILSVCLQSAVEIVQVFDTAYLACCSIEQLCWGGLRNRVIALLLISRDKVLTIFVNRSVEF